MQQPPTAGEMPALFLYLGASATKAPAQGLDVRTVDRMARVTLIGVQTPGRLVATSAFNMGFRYRVILPAAVYFTWNGTNLEGRGLVPDIAEQLSPEAVWSREDNQIKRAVDCLKHAATAA